MEKYIKYIKDLIGPSKDYIFRNIEIDKTNVFIGYNEVLASSSDINHFILKRMMTLTKKQLKSILNYLPTANTKEIKLEEAVYYLNNGFLVFIINKKVYASEVRRAIERGITTIESELSLTGPKDSFSEMFNTNLGLIRRKIKSDSLWWDELTLGTDTKTRVGIIYMNNIVDKKLIEDVTNKLNKINIDGIIDSAYLKDSLESDSLFPTISLTERSDKACMALLEGKILIMVDTSSYVLILPNFFIDYFHISTSFHHFTIRWNSFY